MGDADTKKLKLKNFRGVKEGEVELGNMTVLIGANNSGKSTILEALFLLSNPLRSVPYMKEYSKPREESVALPLNAVSLIHELHKTLTSAGYAFLLYKYTADEAMIEMDNINLRFIKMGHEIYLSTNKQVHSYVTTPAGNIPAFGRLGVSNDWVDPAFSDELLAEESLLVSAELIKHAYWYMHNNWANIMNLGITKEVAKDISRLVNENFVNITIEPFLGGRLAVFGFLEDGTRIRLGDFGAGAQIYITTRILYELTKPKLLLWDDVEAHMNPRMLVRLAEWFSELIESGVQVVTTTHSLEAAKIIAEFIEDAKICTTTLKDGVLKTRKLSIDEVNSLLSAGIDVRLADTVIV
jgi:ABC-type polar amino acid transport system ATPase subunit